MLPAILSLLLLLAIGPAIEITVEEPIRISHSMTPNNNCSAGWHIEGDFFPIESDYEGKGYAQTITIYDLNDMNKTISRALNSEFLKDVRMEGHGLTKQGDYVGAWDGKYWGPFSSSVPVLEHPSVVGITSQTDTSIIPYGEIFTIPTLPSPWNTKTFVAVDPGSDITGKQVNIYTGIGNIAKNESVRITGIGNILCIYKQLPAQDSIITTGNVSIGDPVYDQFDSYIINASNDYGITDEMMIKSMIAQESRFDIFAISSDIPCGMPSGWTDNESRSFGLMQFTPACAEAGGNRPNLMTDKNSPNWATSWFNPEYNINQGAKSISDNLLLMKSKFAGCSDEQYMLMAVGAYNSGEGAIYGCDLWNDRADRYITDVIEHHRVLSQIARLLRDD
jgi:3D (Asp-Asp-Asp) domain-containing protein